MTISPLQPWYSVHLNGEKFYSLLTVAGNIHAREVTVRITARSHFVFAEDYALPDLKAVEAYFS